jgi:hypothetical protein
MDPKAENWIVAFDGPGRPENIKIFNLNQVRMADQVRHDHIRLWFGEAQVVEMNGKAAGDLGRLLISRAIATDGTPMPQFAEITMLGGVDEG